MDPASIRCVCIHTHTFMLHGDNVPLRKVLKVGGSIRFRRGGSVCMLLFHMFMSSHHNKH